MCGICGYIHLDKTKRPSEAILKAMTRTLTHRGPDDEGYYIQDNAALGHRRLSIIDLVTGHQPMSNADSSLTIVYNGEVYNFQEIKKELSEKGRRFRTGSDTEVILHAYEEYGEKCLDKFSGMFALAIWNSKDNTLFLARDRFGKKPLYYAVFDNQFVFASELKSILKHPSARKIIDIGAVAKYLAYEYIPSPYSIFKDIKKLEAGCKLILKNGKVNVERYWDLNLKNQVCTDVRAAEEQLLKLLKESVKKRLISDVPLGVFLSGGIDSSSVVAMMSQLVPAKAIKTFSISFKEEGFDESCDAKRVADFFGTDHRQEVLGADTMLEILPSILDILDEPFADSSIIPTYLVSRFTRKHVKVALGGDGGDELFLGYPSFLAYRIEDYLNILPDPIRKAMLDSFIKLMPNSQKHMNLASYARRFARGMAFPQSLRHQAWIGAFTPKEESGLFRNKDLTLDALDIYNGTNVFFQNVKFMHPLVRAMYIYIKTYMTDDILTKVDRASMANSLEVRAPFLDTDFAEFAAAIPHQLKLKGLTSKWILKNALKGKLPPETLKKGKRGFAVPVAKWIKEDLKPMIDKAFDKAKIEREGIFDHAYIKNLIDGFVAGKNDARKEIWSLFMFEMWYDKWM